MGYFDDLICVAGEIMPRCQAYLDRRFAGTWSLEYLHAGRMEMSIDGGSIVVIDRPAAFWHLPRHRYRYGAIDARGWDHHWVLLAGSRAERLVEELARTHPAGWCAVADPEPFRLRMHELVGRCQAADAGQHPATVALVEDLVARLVARPASPGSRPAARLLAERLRADPARAWDLDAEARRLQVSAVHLRREFRRLHGCSPRTWLLTWRMHGAALALAGGASVADAGRVAGYSDPAQFSRMFKRITGRSPSRHRAGDG